VRNVFRAVGLALALGTLMVPSVGAAQRSAVHADPLATRSSDGRTSASLQSNGADAQGGWSYTITVRRPRESKSITLASIIVKPLELHVTPAGDRAIVIGWANGTGQYAFDVVDLVAGKLLVEVPCYQPAVAPSGRYIAFVQWFEPHLTALAPRSAVYRVADVRRLRREGGSIQYVVGTVVYPASPVVIAPSSPSTGVARIHMMAGKFRWNGDSQLAFRDLYQNRAPTVHVAIGASGLRSVVVTAR
jgi:hypothetical protein